MTLESHAAPNTGSTEGTTSLPAVDETRPGVARARSITVTRNGPYLVEGAVPLANQTIESDSEGGSREWLLGQSFEVADEYRLCRCGQSANKPFCDGTHLVVAFDGTETASMAPYLEQADVFEGPTTDLTDAQPFCAGARFCDPDGAIWNLIEQTDSVDAQEKVKHQSGHCPSGRLVVWDKTTRKPYEPVFEPSLGLVQDPVAGVSGPIWVRGEIPIVSADGQAYEIRNRVTLCRCGASANKPYCDGSHITIRFRDGS
jgi:CDGSH-type Zn-finger protein